VNQKDIHKFLKRYVIIVDEVAYAKSYTDDSLVLKLEENGYIHILGSKYYPQTNFGIDWATIKYKDNKIYIKAYKSTCGGGYIEDVIDLDKIKRENKDRNFHYTIFTTRVVIEDSDDYFETSENLCAIKSYVPIGKNELERIKGRGLIYGNDIEDAIMISILPTHNGELEVYVTMPERVLKYCEEEYKKLETEREKDQKSKQLEFGRYFLGRES